MPTPTQVRKSSQIYQEPNQSQQSIDLPTTKYERAERTDLLTSKRADGGAERREEFTNTDPIIQEEGRIVATERVSV